MCPLFSPRYRYTNFIAQTKPTTNHITNSLSLSLSIYVTLCHQSLLSDPNPNSPANSMAAQLYKENRREYEKRVKACVEQSFIDQPKCFSIQSTITSATTRTATVITAPTRKSIASTQQQQQLQHNLNKFNHESIILMECIVYNFNVNYRSDLEPEPILAASFNSTTTIHNVNYYFYCHPLKFHQHYFFNMKIKS